MVPSQKVQSRRPPYKCHDLLDHVFHHSLNALLQREPEERFQDKGGQCVSSKRPNVNTHTRATKHILYNSFLPDLYG